MENSIKIDCHFCSKNYEILYENDTQRPEYCAFCGEIIELVESDEDDNWDN
jgi:hypothetical protein